MQRIHTTLLIAFAMCTCTLSAEGQKLPLPQTLCGHRHERTVRHEVKALGTSAQRGKLAGPMPSPSLVPCGHGDVRFLRTTIANHSILALVEEDKRPSYRSGGSHYRSFAIVEKTLVHDPATLWSRFSRQELHKQEIAALLVVSIMLQNKPHMVFTSQQARETSTRWPKTAAAFALAPPGISIDKAGETTTLQAWSTHSYYERGVSCRFLNGWQATFNARSGLKVIHNHQYAEGKRLGRPCGTPLPQ